MTMWDGQLVTLCRDSSCVRQDTFPPGSAVAQQPLTKMAACMEEHLNKSPPAYTDMHTVPCKPVLPTIPRGEWHPCCNSSSASRGLGSGDLCGTSLGDRCRRPDCLSSQGGVGDRLVTLADTLSPRSRGPLLQGALSGFKGTLLRGIRVEVLLDDGSVLCPEVSVNCEASELRLAIGGASRSIALCSVLQVSTAPGELEAMGAAAVGPFLDGRCCTMVTRELGFVTFRLETPRHCEYFSACLDLLVGAARREEEALATSGGSSPSACAGAPSAGAPEGGSDAASRPRPRVGDAGQEAPPQASAVPALLRLGAAKATVSAAAAAAAEASSTDASTVVVTPPRGVVSSPSCGANVSKQSTGKAAAVSERQPSLWAAKSRARPKVPPLAVPLTTQGSRQESEPRSTPNGWANPPPDLQSRPTSSSQTTGRMSSPPDRARASSLPMPADGRTTQPLASPRADTGSCGESGSVDLIFAKAVPKLGVAAAEPNAAASAAAAAALTGAPEAANAKGTAEDFGFAAAVVVDASSPSDAKGPRWPQSAPATIEGAGKRRHILRRQAAAWASALRWCACHCGS